MSEPLLPPTIGRLKDPVPLLEQRLALAEAENEKLHRKVSLLTQQLAEVQGLDSQLALDELLDEFSEAELDRLRKERAEIESQKKLEAEKKRKKPRRGHGPRPQPGLPTVEELHELPEDQTECEVCGGQMVPMGEQFEESEAIHVIERRYVKKQIRRRKYRCNCNSCVVTAPASPRVIPGGRYTNDFILHVVGEKWLNHTPLERQSRNLARLGLEVRSQTLFDQAFALAKLVRPIYDRLGERVLEAPVIHVDETRWPRLDKKAETNSTVWARTTPDIAHYSILGSRSQSAADRLLKGYEGTLVADGYTVYESLARDGPDLYLANCWAHVLRKIRDQEKNFPKESHRGMSLIGELYKIERKVEGPFPGDAEAQRQRLELREKESRKAVDDFFDWVATVAAPPKSGLGKAVRYALKRRQGLSRFLIDPKIALDNNPAERALRDVVIGRKVHYGSKSKRGTEVASIFYTLFETAELCGVEPMGYLRAATEAALETPSRVLLPHELMGSKAPSLSTTD